MKRLLLLFLLLSCTSPKIIFDNGAEFSVEYARTPEEHMQGLMFRSSMPENHGMLFIFTDKEPLTFWMKNTFIPLDMVFLDENMAVVEVKSNIPPCSMEPCPTYTSMPAQYVFEINAGLAEKNNIVVGSRIT
ncbi:MAG TPA: DUF192 domain-containing protein [Candidatus Nanoarchaeia archaeon]|nr:DUF192 domain-containing protein [Candidatus Nanoarchaeia archaeon]